MKRTKRGFCLPGGILVNMNVVNALTKQGILQKEMRFSEKIATIRKLFNEAKPISAEVLVNGVSSLRKWPNTIYLYHHCKNIVFALASKSNQIPAAFKPRFIKSNKAA